MRVRRGVRILGRVVFLRPRGQERRNKVAEVRDGGRGESQGRRKEVLYGIANADKDYQNLTGYSTIDWEMGTDAHECDGTVAGQVRLL